MLFVVLMYCCWSLLRCVRLQFGGEETQNEAWSWLADNQLSSVVNTKESRFDSSFSLTSSCEFNLWNLLLVSVSNLHRTEDNSEVKGRTDLILF